MIYGLCKAGKHKGFFIKRRKIKLPTGEIALSQKPMCYKCQKVIQKAVNKK